MQATSVRRYPAFRNYRVLRNPTEADLIFREDAERLGYLRHPRGMARYYRDHGILPPRHLDEALPRVEFTNFDFERIASSN